MSVTKPTKKEHTKMNSWRKDPRMVFLSNPQRDLTAKERKEWEQRITEFQLSVQ